MAIPKTIHYCWFGGNPLPEETIRYIESWKKFCPDYQIKEWNETNFDIHCCKYVEEAYTAKKWAFVSDYARFLALYKEGGIYFDTDIEVLRSFDDLLGYNAFFGFGRQSLTLPVFGADKNQQCFADILDDYANRHFVKEDGSYDTTTIELTAQRILLESYGLKLNWEKQILKDNIAILPKDCFSSTDWATGIVTKNPNLYVIHYAEASWMDDGTRQLLLKRRRFIKLFGKTLGNIIGDILTFKNQNGWNQTFVKVRSVLKRGFVHIIMALLNTFCLKRKKVVFENFGGRGFGDNPKYVANELLSRDLGYDLVWLVKPGTNYQFPQGIRTIPVGGLKEMYELATSKVWVDNNRKQRWVRKAKNQKYIQTWHGFYPLKKMEKDAIKTLSADYISCAIHDGAITDLMMSGSKARTPIYKSSFWYDGEVLECGTPRNDVFFNGIDYRKIVGEFFGITLDKKLLLYAPTFRDDHSIAAYNIEFNGLLSSLSKRFGGEWCVMVRLHPAVREKSKELITYDSHIIDASAYDDIQELFAACDMLISDYSDCMFEFSLTYKPVLLYAADLEAFTHGRSFYYDIRELPYQLTESNDELMEAIEGFNEDEYKKRLKAFFDKIVVLENGTASKTIVDYIIKHTQA